MQKILEVVSPKKMKKEQAPFLRSFTNQVLCQKGDKAQAVFYVPGYLRMKVKNFTQMEIGSLKAEMNATIIFTVFYGSLPSILVNHLIHNLVFHFGRDDAMKLNTQNLQITLKHKEKDKQFTYTVRKIFKTRIQCNVFWSPFQLVNLILSITLQSVPFKIVKDGKKVLSGQIKFNLMDHANRFMKASYSQQGRFGNYDLAQALMDAQYSSQRITKQMKQQIDLQKQQRQRNKKKISKKSKQLTLKQQFPLLIKRIFQDALHYSRSLVGSKSQSNKMDESNQKQDNKIKHFQYAHFTVPLYRLPASAIVTIFLPLWLLGIINLGIFFQSNDLGNRIASLATMMIAFMSLIATIRQQIPPSPKITMVQILVYLQTFTSFLGFIHSLNIRNRKKFIFHWYRDPLFLIALIITIFNICIVVILYMKHKLIWQPSYNRYQDQQQSIKFQSKKWKNQQCDRLFQKHRNKFLTIQDLQESDEELIKLIKSDQVQIQQVK